MKVLDRCGSVYRNVQSANTGCGGAQSGSGLVKANCGNKQEKNTSTCGVTASGNDTTTVKLDSEFSAGLERGRMSSWKRQQGVLEKGKVSSRKEQQGVLQESDNSALLSSIRSGCTSPSTLMCYVKNPSQVADNTARYTLIVSCE